MSRSMSLINIIVLLLSISSIYFISLILVLVKLLLDVIYKFFLLITFGCLALKLIFYIVKRHQHDQKEDDKSKGNYTTLGFFHPYCNSGGGGERVLWLMISSLLTCEEIAKRIRILVYTGDQEKDVDILEHVYPSVLSIDSFPISTYITTVYTFITG